MLLNAARFVALRRRVVLPAYRLSRLSITVALGLCGLLFVTFCTRLLNPLARLIDVRAPGDAFVALSFYQPEQAGDTSFRWSGPHSVLALPAHDGP